MGVLFTILSTTPIWVGCYKYHALLGQTKKPRAGLKLLDDYSGGEEEIRTPGTVARTHAFQACQFNHSCTSP